MDVLTAVITAKGEFTMTTNLTQDQAVTDGRELKPGTKANTASRNPRVAPAKGKPSKKARSAKRAAKAPKAAEVAKPEKTSKHEKAGIGGTREGSKSAAVVELLKRPDGATLKEIMKATGWQPHSVRGFISGTLGKKMRLKVESAKREDGERVYSLSK